MGLARLLVFLVAASTSRARCPGGKYVSFGALLQSECSACIAGRFSDGSALSCTACPGGKDSSVGESACKTCRLGFSSTRGGVCTLVKKPPTPHPTPAPTYHPTRYPTPQPTNRPTPARIDCEQGCTCTVATIRTMYYPTQSQMWVMGCMGQYTQQGVHEGRAYYTLAGGVSTPNTLGTCGVMPSPARLARWKREHGAGGNGGHGGPLSQERMGQPTRSKAFLFWSGAFNRWVVGPKVMPHTSRIRSRGCDSHPPSALCTIPRRRRQSSPKRTPRTHTPNTVSPPVSPPRLSPHNSWARRGTTTCGLRSWTRGRRTSSPRQIPARLTTGRASGKYRKDAAAMGRCVTLPARHPAPRPPARH
jgi:hypothetical protein